MSKLSSPLDYWANAMQLTHVMTEAHSVIGMRVLGAMGMWSVPKTENSRMLNEKVAAFVKAGTDASAAVLSGQSPEVVTAAAIKPIRQATRANHKRLKKRGMKKV